jgi:hypothetical protein
MQSMVIYMNDQHLQTLPQLQAFLDGTVALDFALAAEERYEFIARILRRFAYPHLKRAHKAVVLRFLERVTGYSRQQRTRLVKRGVERRPLLKRYCASRTSFATLYTPEDILSSPWHLLTLCTALYPAPPPRSSWSGPSHCMARCAMSGLAPSR